MQHLSIPNLSMLNLSMQHQSMQKYPYNASTCTSNPIKALLSFSVSFFYASFHSGRDLVPHNHHPKPTAFSFRPNTYLAPSFSQLLALLICLSSQISHFANPVHNLSVPNLSTWMPKGLCYPDFAHTGQPYYVLNDAEDISCDWRDRDMRMRRGLVSP